MIWHVIWLAVIMGGLGGLVRFIKALSSKIDIGGPLAALTANRDHHDTNAMPSKTGTPGPSINLPSKRDASTGMASWYYEGQTLTKGIFFGNAVRDSILGMAGGLSLAGLAAALNMLNPEKETSQTELGFIVAFFVAGIAGRKVLDFATDKLMDQLSAAESQIVISQQSIREAHAEIEQQKCELLQQSEDLKEQSRRLEDAARKAQRAQVITSATTQLMRSLPSELPGVVRELQGERQANPSDRTIAVLLGRAHRQMSEFDAAIGVLDDFLSTIKKEERVEDYADALYNRACYKALKAEKEHEGDLARDALRDLRSSISLLPANRLDAEEDSDFKYIKESLPNEWNQVAEQLPKK